MALDSRYFVAPSLEMYFVDKDNGLPLSGGKVYFWADESRSVPRDAYTISGSPPNYMYVPLPNPVTLSSVGTVQDNDGNNVLPYYLQSFDSEGNALLYFIEVKDHLGVLQFTREGWPNFVSGDISEQNDITNFVPNGQFLLHTNIGASSENDFIAGQVWQDTTNIAQGGWTFERTAASTAIDTISFHKYEYVESPTGNPQFAVDITCQVVGTDEDKNLCLRFPNVNKFASPNSSLQYNLYFEAESLGAEINNIGVDIKKYFGSGGATDETINVGSFNLTNDVSKKNFTLSFGTNAGQAIGSGGDDYVQIRIKFPPTSTFSVRFTNFCISVNDSTLESFPTQTNAQQLDASTSGWLPTPNPDGSDLYLPIILNQTGFGFDYTVVGRVYATTISTEEQGVVDCNGTGYLTREYKTNGVPNSRLQKRLFDNSTGMPIFGTGLDFLNMYSTNATNTLMVCLNKPDVQTAIADSISNPTGFTFTNGKTGVPGYGFLGYPGGGNTVWILDDGFGAPADVINAGTSGFTVEIYRLGAAGTETVTKVTVNALPAAGTYFYISNTTTKYYLWFKINGSGSDPAPGGTGILLNLLSTFNATDVSRAIAAAIYGFQVSYITTVAGSSIPPNSYFLMSANSNNYYVWYSLNGTGTDPDPASTLLGISVTYTAAQATSVIATNTKIASNSTYYAVPDLRGVFVRGWNQSAVVDPDSATRFSLNGYNVGDLVGTQEFDQFASHYHSSTLSNFLNNPGHDGDIALNFGSNGLSSPNTTNAGGGETRPLNTQLNYVIKY